MEENCLEGKNVDHQPELNSLIKSAEIDSRSHPMLADNEKTDISRKLT